ncbi:MAG: hypothetical protein GY711_21260 [bacterium]|nr:hypothetical protein [bacterium]
MDKHTHWGEYALLGLLVGVLLVFAIGTAVHLSKPVQVHAKQATNQKAMDQWQNELYFPRAKRPTTDL